MDRRKRVVQKRRGMWEAIRALLKSDNIEAGNKVLLGIYKKGWAANQKGQHRFTNPYSSNIPYRDEWNRGWMECSRIIKRRSTDTFEGQFPRNYSVLK